MCNRIIKIHVLKKPNSILILILSMLNKLKQTTYIVNRYGSVPLLTVWYPPAPPPPPLLKMAIFSLFLWIVGIDRSKKKEQKMQSDFFRNFEFLGVFLSFKFLKIFFIHFTAFIIIQKR